MRPNTPRQPSAGANLTESLDKRDATSLIAQNESSKKRFMLTSRRFFLEGLGACVGCALTERMAFASPSRELALSELLAHSDHAVVATPLDAAAAWAVLGGKRRIVTDVRVRVEEVLALRTPAQNELLVRVLGGTLDGVGQLVDGEVRMAFGEPCALLLTADSATLSYVTGRTQGHYPLRPDAQKVLRLTPSPTLPELRHPEKSAVHLLSGRTVAEARELMRGAAP